MAGGVFIPVRSSTKEIFNGPIVHITLPYLTFVRQPGCFLDTSWVLHMTSIPKSVYSTYKGTDVHAKVGSVCLGVPKSNAKCTGSRGFVEEGEIR